MDWIRWIFFLIGIAIGLYIPKLKDGFNQAVDIMTAHFVAQNLQKQMDKLNETK